MAESSTPRLDLPRWTEDTDTPNRVEFDRGFLRLEERAAGFLSGTAAARPVAGAAYARFYYYADDTDVLSVCVDTTGAGGWAWVGPLLTEAAGNAAYVNVSGDTMTGALLLPAGGGSAPSLSFAADTNTGLYNPVADKVSIAAGGTFACGFTANGIDPIGVRNADGTAAAPAYTFSSDTDTGIYRAGTNVLDISLGGTATARFQAGGVSMLDGTATAPAFTFINDGNTGIYRASSDRLDIALGGEARVAFGGATTDRFVVPLINDAIRFGGPSNRWKEIYATTATINTSDETQKNTVVDTPLGLDFVKAIRPIDFKFNDGTRTHVGFSAQQVAEALAAVGAGDRAIYIDPSVEANARTNPYAAAKPTPEFVADYLPEPLDADADAEDRAEHAREEAAARQRAAEEWAEARAAFDAETEAMRTAPKGLRYSELLAPTVKAVQELADRVEHLEAENATLRDSLAALADRVTALEGANP